MMLDELSRKEPGGQQLYLEEELSDYADDLGAVEDYEEDMDDGWPLKRAGGPDIIDSMKPAFYFNAKQEEGEHCGSRESADFSKNPSMTPQFINTPSNSS